MKTNTEFVKYVAGLIGFAYAYGVQGVYLTPELLEAKARQYPKVYTPEYLERTRKKSLGRRCFDCTTAADLFTGTDRSANGWLAAAQFNRLPNGDIRSIPEIPGLSVHYDGHMGVYIGNGEVIEARGVDYGVVKTKLKDRPWKYWAKVPGISYEKIYPVPKRLLYLRKWFLMRGDDVRWVQQKLTNAGFNCDVDGVLGGLTDKEIRRFQKSRGLKVDGEVGPITRAALGA
jgi:hypothetical protein